MMDEDIEKTKSYEVGNTGTIVFINNNYLYCANVGDSSCCLLGKKNVQIEDICSNKVEKKRIEKEGEQVIEDRLDGI